VRIFTGAPLPDGADAIVIQEDTARDGDVVLVREAAPAGHYVRPAGLDFREGDLGLRAGRRLTARDIGLAAAMNRPWLLLRRKPRIAILPTGDEVVMPGDPVGPNQIVSSNGLALAALVDQCGGIPVHLPIAADDSRSLQRIAVGAEGVDFLVTTGGASVGEHDLVRDALAETGLALDFWKIAMRPGKPLMVGRYRDTPMMGLPGNPVSSLVCGLLFLKPAIERLLGLDAVAATPSRARLAVPLPANDRRQDYLRAMLARAADGTLEARPFPRQDSSMMSLLARSDCLVIRQPHAPAAAAGEMVEILPLDDSQGLF
jgi:molybdopterin molybdotransferase